MGNPVDSSRKNPLFGTTDPESDFLLGPGKKLV